MRKFAVVNEYKDKGINIPKRTTKFSAGYDLEAAETVILPPFLREKIIDKEYSIEESSKYNKESQVNSFAVLVPTGLKVYCNDDEYVSFVMRSSIASKCNIIMPNAPSTIDADYVDNEKNEGHCFIPLLNLNPYPVVINKGERIAQAIFHKYLTIDNEEVTEDTRIGGFGSTNKE